MGSKIALFLGLGALFVVTVAAGLRLMPQPHRPTDYLVLGTIATFLCLAILFLLTALNRK